MGLVDEQGNVFSHPPIHLHHANNWFGYPSESSKPVLNDFMPFSIYVSTHFAGAVGDRECDDAHGGIGCLYCTMPEGYALKFVEDNTKPVLDFIVNNVGEKDLENVYLEYSVTTVSESATSASSSFRDAYALTFFPHTPVEIPFGVYMVPGSSASLHWKVFEMPSNGKLVASDFHGHRGEVTHYVSILVGITNLDAIQLPDRTDDTIPYPSSLSSSEEFDSDLDQRVARHGQNARVLCSVEFRVNEQGYDRAPFVRNGKQCADWTFHRGEHVILMSYHMNPTPEPKKMHTAWLPLVEFDF